MSVTLHDTIARLLLGETVDLGELAHVASTLTRLAARLGTTRRLKDMILDPLEYAARHDEATQ